MEAAEKRGDYSSDSGAGWRHQQAVDGVQVSGMSGVAEWPPASADTSASVSTQGGLGEAVTRARSHTPECHSAKQRRATASPRSQSFLIGRFVREGYFIG
jgi:hypothetical protein